MVRKGRNNHRNSRNNFHKSKRSRRGNSKKFIQHRRHRKKPFSRRKLFGIIPYYITFSIILIILGIFVIRISPTLFGFSEWTFWFEVLGGLLIFSGILMLIAYWRNNVSNLTTRHSVHWN